MPYKINPLDTSIKIESDNGLKIRIETKDIIIRSITDDPLDTLNACELYDDPEVVKKFAGGTPVPEDRIKERVKCWSKRFKSNDPFSAYVVSDKATGEFVGIAIIGHSTPGVSEAAYLTHKKFWAQGYGKAVSAVLQCLIPNLMLKGYKLDGKELKKIVATARYDNVASKKLLENSGFKEIATIQKFGDSHLRSLYEVSAKAKRNNYLNFFTRKDAKLGRQQYNDFVHGEADVSAEEMAKVLGGYAAKRKTI